MGIKGIFRLGLILTVMAAAASAATYQYVYTGNLFDVFSGNPSPFAPGDLLTISLATDAPMYVSNSDTEYPELISSGHIMSWTFSVGAWVFAGTQATTDPGATGPVLTQASFTTTNGVITDWSVYAWVPATGDTTQGGARSLTLYGDPFDFVTDVSGPSTASAANFPLQGSWQEIAPIPEPGTWTLFLLGIGGIALSRRWSRVRNWTSRVLQG